jgi:uncharacterized protein YegP (UPF0339 family)
MADRDRTVVYVDDRGRWRWRRVAPNRDVIAVSDESYASIGDAERAAEAVFGSGKEQED